MEVNIQVEHAAKGLDQIDNTGLPCAACKAGLADQVGVNAAVDDAQHLADHIWTAGKQERSGCARSDAQDGQR